MEFGGKNGCNLKTLEKKSVEKIYRIPIWSKK